MLFLRSFAAEQVAVQTRPWWNAHSWAKITEDHVSGNSSRCYWTSSNEKIGKKSAQGRNSVLVPKGPALAGKETYPPPRVRIFVNLFLGKVWS